MGKFDKSYAELQKELAAQDAQRAEIQNAETRFENTGDIGALISFWESLWNNGGLLFNGSRWAFRLTDLYIKIKEYDKALRALKRIKGKAYQDKKQSYIQRIEKLSNK